MAEMTAEMMELINNMPAPYLATTSKEGVPNVVPCGSTRAINPDTITITALHFDKTFKNLEKILRWPWFFIANWVRKAPRGTFGAGRSRERQPW